MKSYLKLNPQKILSEKIPLGCVTPFYGYHFSDKSASYQNDVYNNIFLSRERKSAL